MVRGTVYQQPFYSKVSGMDFALIKACKIAALEILEERRQFNHYLLGLDYLEK